MLGIELRIFRQWRRVAVAISLQEAQNIQKMLEAEGWHRIRITGKEVVA